MSNILKLYLIHCGYYDSQICDGVYESHVNYFVVAPSYAEAKVQARALPEFLIKRMHIDGVQEISVINGYRIRLVKDSRAKKQSTSSLEYA